MTKTILPLFALLRGSAFLLAANGLHGLLLPLRGQAEGFSNFALGLLGTAWAAGFVAGCFIAPRMVRKVGHVRAMSTFAAILGSVALLTGLIVDETFWIVSRLVTGFAACGAIMVTESWLNEASTNEQRGTIFGIYQILTFVAIMVGQLVVAFSDIGGEKLFMVAGILYSLALMPTAMSTTSTPRPLLEAKLDVGRLYRHSPVAFVGAFMIGGANGAWGTLGPVLGIDYGLTPLAIAVMMSGTMIAGAVLQIPVGRLSDRIDRRFVLGGSAVAAVLAAVAFVTVQPQSVNAIIVLASLYGAFAYTLYSIAVAHANDHAGEASFVTISSGLLLLYGFGTIAGPLFGSWMMDVFGTSGLLVATGFFHAAMVIYVAVRISLRAAPKEKMAFQPMPSQRAVSPEAMRLDPRRNSEESRTAPADGSDQASSR